MLLFHLIPAAEASDQAGIVINAPMSDTALLNSMAFNIFPDYQRLEAAGFILLKCHIATGV